MNDKDYSRIHQIVIETLINDWRAAGGVRIPKADREHFEKLADEIVYNLKLFEKPAANADAPLPGQIDLFTGEIVVQAHPEPAWIGDLCPRCGGSGFVMVADGRVRGNCPTCHGAGDKAGWERQKAERERLPDAQPAL